MTEVLNRKKILLIDDEVYILTIIKEYLESLDFEVVTSSQGPQGLELALRLDPDAVICDLNMPVMDGMKVLAELAKSRPLLPFIIFSGTGDINDAINALKKGAWDYLLKPVTNLSLIHHTLQRSFERQALLKEKEEYHSRLEEQVRERTLALEQQILQHKATERLLRESLKEKEVLLAEVHHRVKNNLQIIISLLSLQAAEVRDEALRQVLQESQNRIQAMSLIHERLYESVSVSQVDCQEYFRDISDQLVASLDVYKNLRVDLKLNGFVLAATKAFPAGLLFNEVLFAILEHRPDNRFFEIVVRGQRSEDLVLRITDSGGALKDWSPGGGREDLSLTLMNILAHQAQGSWSFSSEGGGLLEIRLQID